MASLGSVHSRQQRKLLPLSILGFFLYSAIGCLVPFLNLQARDLGLDEQEIFLANCGAGIFSLVLVPLFGLLAEKCARYKTCAVICIIIAALFYTTLLVVPRSLRSPRVPQMDFDCRDALRMERCPNWASCSDATKSSSNFTEFELSTCRYICHGQQGRRPPPDASYPLHICFRSEEGNFCHVHDPLAGPPSEVLPVSFGDFESNSSSSFIFHSRFSNWYADDMADAPLSDFLSSQESSPDHLWQDINEGILTGGDYPESSGNDEQALEDAEELVPACKFRPVYPLVVNGKSYDDIFCRPLPSGCSVRCKVKLTGSRSSPVKCFDVSGDPFLTFLYYTGARAFGDSCLLATVAIFEVAILASVRDYDGLYGRSRWSSALGLLLFPPISGVVIDYYSSIESKGEIQHNYSPAFILFDGLAIILIVLFLALPLDVAVAGVKGKYVVNSPQRHQMREDGGGKKRRGRSGLCVCEAVVFVILLLVLGCMWNILDTFLPPYYVSDNIGSNKFQIGIQWTLAFIGTIPFLAVSKDLVRNIGRSHLLVFGFLFYGIRFAGISFVSDPYWTFPFEAMKALTLSVVWIASVSYGHALVNFSSSSHSASVASVVRATAGDRYRLRVHYLLLLTHFGLGRVIGSTVGYFLIEYFGLQWSFRGIAIFSASAGLLYLLAYHTCMKSSRMDVRKKRRVGVVPPSSATNGSWCPLVEQPVQQQRNNRPNGDARTEQQRLLRNQNDYNVNNNEPNQEQPILMIDE